MSKEDYINNTIPHDSAFKHVDGTAEYTDDMMESDQTLFGEQNGDIEWNRVLTEDDDTHDSSPMSGIGECKDKYLRNDTSHNHQNSNSEKVTANPTGYGCVCFSFRLW